jgi:malonate-semialdehyde dehydrogenase (acetylating)/methylmalonate-semialdehyde dehydrogenase
MPKKLGYFINNTWQVSKTSRYLPVYNPSTGEVMAETPDCTKEEIAAAVMAAKDAFPSWSETPVVQRVQVLFELRNLLRKNINDLATLLSMEMGKTHTEAIGSLERGIEIVEYACGMPTLMKGDALDNMSSGIDIVTYRKPLGVCAGIVPFNFPAMIPLWMYPIAIACGNTFVLKASNPAPQSAMKQMDLLVQAGFPKGVVNLVTSDAENAQVLLEHPDVKAVSFVGSSRTAQHVYHTATLNGKRVQALGQAKNHALVMPDVDLDRTTLAIVNAAFGCAGERCMALPVVVAHQDIADSLVQKIVEASRKIKVGESNSEDTTMGPLISRNHLEKVLGYIEKGTGEGAKLMLDGRECKVEGYPGGFYLGPTIFDRVTGEMTIGREEIFGPVLCIKRAADFEEGIRIINVSVYGNGSAIFTQSGFYAREFVRRVETGMVGVNVGIPVPLGFFSFTGWKRSFFGDLHSHGRDGLLFYTETKSITSRWFTPGDAGVKKVKTWD